MDSSAASVAQGAGATTTPQAEAFLAPPQLALLDFFFPGFSVFSTAVQKYLHIDLNLYIPLVLLCGGLTFAWRYLSEYVWGLMETHLMSTVDLRNDDETYNWLMAWVAAQNFAQRSRRFVVNSNLNSRSWFLWWDNYDDDDNEDEEGTERKAKKRPLQYTPTFGSHFFWFKGHLLIFRRTQNSQQGSYLVVSEREEISVACFGRNPWILKELLLEARDLYTKRDEQKTVIFRGTTKGGSTEPTWQRCMARTARPFSTVILNEDVKKQLIDDVSDYLNPNTRRWYANRGIPYRRGYLLYGPPGTGKSSLSLALAGFFKMRIYIVSLSSVTANEENLSSLFAELPRRCVVLLEDIDTAGLTHTRENKDNANTDNAAAPDMVPGQITPGAPPANANNSTGRLSLSGLLNILDGVASQEGRVLIMTTNHIEKLDKALIRPGRVDMSVKFDKADDGMNAAMFRAIFAPLEGDEDDNAIKEVKIKALIDPEAEAKKLEEEKRKRAEVTAKIEKLADEFAARIPSHEFSPAEIQGFLLKNKRDPEGVVAGAENWVVEARKEKKEKELKEAEDKRKAEEEEEKKKKEEEEKKKKEEEEEKTKKEEEEKKAKKEKKKEEKKAKKEKKKSKSKSRKAKDDSDSDSSDSDSSSSESEAETEAKPAAKSKKASKEKDAKEKDADAAVVVVEPPKKPDEIKIVEVQVEKPVDSPLSKELMAEEVKHGGDSGYGTP